MSLAFFALSTLELLGALDDTDSVTANGNEEGRKKQGGLSRGEKAAYADWIYAQQHPDGGFRGSPFVGLEVRSPSLSLFFPSLWARFRTCAAGLMRHDGRTRCSSRPTS
jgi:hypothetical protein